MKSLSRGLCVVAAINISGATPCLLAAPGGCDMNARDVVASAERRQ
jgi:hypothetical protein